MGRFAFHMNAIFLPLPLAEISDLLGVLVFVIVAIVSALGKRLGSPAENEEETPSKPARRVPPRRPAPSQPEIPSPFPIPDLAEEMRRFLEGTRRIQEKAPPPPLKPAPKRSLQPPRAMTEPPSVPKIQSPRTLHEEVSQSMEKALHQEAVPSEPAESPFSQSPPSGQTSPSPSFRLDRSLLASPSSLKQAIVAAEILGKPRALAM